MRISREALRLIEEHEGFRPSLYNDAAGHCTIGYGTLVHRGPHDAADAREQAFLAGISRDVAEQLLRSHAQPIEAALERLVKVALNQGQFDALVAFIYNVGLGAFAGSTLLKKLNAGDSQAVPGEMLRFLYAGGRPLAGLIARRTREGELWRSGGEAPALVAREAEPAAVAS